MAKSSWFPFYAKDWLDFRVLRMDLESQGAYFRILAHMWSDSDDRCSLPADLKQLSKLLAISLTRMGKIWNDLMPQEDPIFQLENGRIVSERLRAEREKQARKSNKARQSASARWTKTQCERNANALPTQCERNATTGANAYDSHCDKEKEKEKVPPTTPLKEKEQRNNTPPISPPQGEDVSLFPDKPRLVGGNREYPALFEEIWEKHPVGTKLAAYKAWRKILQAETNGAGPRPPNDRLKAALTRYLGHCRATRCFAKHLSTFLGPDEPWRQWLEATNDNPYEDL